MIEKKLPLRIGVGAIVLNNENKIFVGKRADNPIDKWQMPQGGVDKGENFITAMKRELKEETNLDGEVTSILSTCSHYGSIFGDILLICVVMNVNDFSNMQAADDAEELSFFDIYDLPELAFYCHNKFINEYKKIFSKNNNL